MYTECRTLTSNTPTNTLTIDVVLGGAISAVTVERVEQTEKDPRKALKAWKLDYSPQKGEELLL